MRLDTRAFAVASAVVAAVIYILGGIIHVFLPWGAPAVVAYVFRVDVIDLARPLTIDSFTVGALMFMAFGGLFGGLTAGLYNRLARVTV